MEIHAPAAEADRLLLDSIKRNHVKQEPVKPFSDPIREFHHASQVEGTVRGWLTYPIEERKRLVKTYAMVPNRGENETEKGYEVRKLERWRGLCVIIQEESRAQAGNRCPEVAIAALKYLFPDHDWKVKPEASVKPAA